MVCVREVAAGGNAQQPPTRAGRCFVWCASVVARSSIQRGGGGETTRVFVRAAVRHVVRFFASGLQTEGNIASAQQTKLFCPEGGVGGRKVRGPEWGGTKGSAPLYMG